MEKSEADFNEVVAKAVELVKVQARHNEVELNLDLAAAPLPVRVDPIQIQQVIVNLLQNGFQAMADTERSERRLSVTTSRTEGGMAQIAVADRGVGLSEEDAERLFESFFTTKQDGLGIGLSISRSIIEKHDGHVWVTPNPDKGVTFRFTLPLG
jgi:signal transduction histidine kinase